MLVGSTRTRRTARRLTAASSSTSRAPHRRRSARPSTSSARPARCEGPPASSRGDRDRVRQRRGGIPDAPPVIPHDPGTFAVAWSITASGQVTTCMQANATTVQVGIVDVESGAESSSSFDCTLGTAISGGLFASTYNLTRSRCWAQTSGMLRDRKRTARRGDQHRANVTQSSSALVFSAPVQAGRAILMIVAVACSRSNGFLESLQREAKRDRHRESATARCAGRSRSGATAQSTRQPRRLAEHVEDRGARERRARPASAHADGAARTELESRARRRCSGSVATFAIRPRTLVRQGKDHELAIPRVEDERRRYRAGHRADVDRYLAQVDDLAGHRSLGSSAIFAA